MTKVISEIMRHTRPYQGAEIVAEIFGKHYAAAVNGALPVVLFCAGSSGKILCSFLKSHGILPVCFCDNNPTRVGAEFCDLPIISFDSLKKEHQRSLILIASTAFQSFIKRQLLDNGFRADRVFSLDTEETSFDLILQRERILMLARNGEPGDLLKNLKYEEEKLQGVYDLLADRKSKDLFVKRLALIASGYDFLSYKNYLNEFSEPCLEFGYENRARLNRGGNYYYFNNDILRLKDDEVLVDGGAYTGDSTEEFIAACQKKRLKFKYIYCFEADQGNYELLMKNTAKYKNVTCLNLGLWSHQTKVRFISSAKTESQVARIQDDGISTPGTADIEIDTTSIDEQSNGEEISLIKMDIEGAELKAVQGAANTIKKYAPKLVISVYHGNSDLFEIPLLVKRILPNYQLYLRHLGNYFDDTVLLAIT